MKRIYTIIATAMLCLMLSISAFAAVSPTARPQKADESMISPNTGYTELVAASALTIAAGSIGTYLVIKNRKS